MFYGPSFEKPTFHFLVKFAKTCVICQANLFRVFVKFAKVFVKFAKTYVICQANLFRDPKRGRDPYFEKPCSK